MGFLSAVARLPRIEDRLAIFFSWLCDRWGRVGREEMLIPIPLSHELIARAIGAQRPPVTSALSQLAKRDLVLRQPDKTWIVRGELASSAVLAAEESRRDHVMHMTLSQ